MKGRKTVTSSASSKKRKKAVEILDPFPRRRKCEPLRLPREGGGKNRSKRRERILSERGVRGGKKCPTVDEIVELRGESRGKGGKKGRVRSAWAEKKAHLSRRGGRRQVLE